MRSTAKTRIQQYRELATATPGKNGPPRLDQADQSPFEIFCQLWRNSPSLSILNNSRWPSAFLPTTGLPMRGSCSAISVLFEVGTKQERIIATSTRQVERR